MYGAKSGQFVCARWVEPILRSHFQTSPCLHRSETQTIHSLGASKIKGSSPESSSKVSGGNTNRVRILDVGAIDNQYLDYTWFDAVPIDLNAQHPSVRAIDFFDFAQEHMLQNPHQPFDAIVQSLVLNFQGDPRRRGDMLALAADPRMLAKNGLLFVALPSASLENSRYCTSEHFVQIAKTLGLQTLDVKKSAKLILLTFKAVRHSIGLKTQRFIYDVDTRQFNYPQEVGRKELRRGRNRNNFAVMLKSTATTMGKKNT